ncbi:hydroxymethylglutaryl-CoA lyase [Roseomonas populi]|uniref:Hydroxymethylglutaryl-CoA lyase n=1 Tax=Roseomonas populi TaxID=3121582 RepID=A0ABT1X4T3_9PROT|nr:hydroxymethylglutaryl-CoA lyase [Roseomonas pecuniae]MCR0982734.1 hydroxymethylglutaryl-CoA lyase [Roseomonas pecuniae]
MSDLPKRVHIQEEGPREGFQIEPGPIPTADKIRLIEALAETGLEHIQVCSFVSPKIVPGWADAEDTVAGFKAKPGVRYTALWFNESGLNRALAFRDKLAISGSISLTASEGFTKKNLNRTHEENLAAMRKQTALHLSHGVPVRRIGVMAAFGCNYQGDISPAQVISTIEDGLAIAAEAGAEITDVSLADTMGWAMPSRIERVLGEVRSRWPEKRITLHLHDTRGLAVANAHAALKMGIDRFDTTVGGLGGCPFAGQKGAAGNICSEELVLLCHEMGIETGVDLDALIEVGRMAEAIVGHQLPSELIHAGSLDAFRKAA